MKAWLDEIVDGIYRGLFALIVLFAPTLALGELAKVIFPTGYSGWSFLGLLCAYFLGWANGPYSPGLGSYVGVI